MKNLQVQITIDESLYLRNPDSSELGKQIVSQSILLIKEIGFESFTFKKLGKIIGSPESSIYRYFENKHALLVYLVSWYWAWMDYRLVFAITNIESTEEKLKRVIDTLVKPVKEDHSISHINEVSLSEIIINESVKAYHTKEVDAENKKGHYKNYKDIVQRVSNLILEFNPNFEYPHMLVTTIIEGSLNQKYFAEHLPSLTDSDSEKDCVSIFYQNLIFSAIS